MLQTAKYINYRNKLRMAVNKTKTTWDIVKTELNIKTKEVTQIRLLEDGEMIKNPNEVASILNLNFIENIKAKQEMFNSNKVENHTKPIISNKKKYVPSTS